MSASNKWRREHPDKEKIIRARSYQNNKDKNRQDKAASDAIYYRKNRNKIIIKVLKWQRDNPDRVAAKANLRRAREIQASGSYTCDEFRDICAQYGNRCLCCGKIKKLTADHVIPLTTGGTNDISNIQPLCRSCNSKKHTKIIDFRIANEVTRRT